MINNIIKISRNYEERVSSLLTKRMLYIKNNLPPIEVIDFETCDTNVELNRTQLVYKHSLLIVKDIIKLKEDSHLDYSDIAYKIIKSWWNRNRYNKDAWLEHSVSERVLNLVYFQKNSSKQLADVLYEEMIEVHLEFLYNENNYKSNNHGLMMDRSLIVGGYYTDNKNYIDKAINRFNIFMFRDFSSQGIHLENSPEYHILAQILVKDIKKTLDYLGLRIDPVIEELIKKAERYVYKIIRPDLTLPLMGDTSFKKLNIKKSYENIIDHTSGVFLFQDRKYSNWLLSSNGYQRITHKHKDDMSIQFSIGELNLLVDSGKFNYDNKSNIREYIVSDKAHSKPFILERRAKYDDKDSLTTTSAQESEDCYYIEMSFIMNNDFQIFRNVILHKSTSTLFVVDRFSSKNKLNFVSNFVFDPILNLHDRENVFYIDKANIKITSNHKMKLRSSNNDGLNWVSNKFNEVMNTNRIIAQTKGEFSTHIFTIANSNIETDIDIIASNLVVKVENRKYVFSMSKIKRW